MPSWRGQGFAFFYDITLQNHTLYDFETDAEVLNTFIWLIVVLVVKSFNYPGSKMWWAAGFDPWDDGRIFLFTAIVFRKGSLDNGRFFFREIIRHGMLQNTSSRNAEECM